MRTLMHTLLPSLALLASPAVAGQPAPVTITIDHDEQFQTWEGFGYSGAWWSHHVGGWDEEVLEEILDLLYTDAGADLDIYRYNPGGGHNDEALDPWRSKVSFETSPGEYDWTVDPNGMRVMRGALERGVESVAVCFYSPPSRLTISGKPSGGPNGASNLKPEDFAEFATYCVDIAEYVRTTMGLDEVAIAPINEPQWRWGETNRWQEGMFLTPEETAGVLRAVADEIDRRDVPLLLEGPEAGEWSRSTLDYIRAMAADEVLIDSLHRLAIHSYWSEPEHRTELRAMLEELDIDTPIVMSEWCHMEWTRDSTMNSALVLADTLYNDLTLGNVVSWSGWLAVNPHDFKTGLIHADWDTNTIMDVPKRLWVVAQFSRFIKPGAVRIRCVVGENETDVRAVAFQDADSDGVTCVLMNFGTEPASVRFDDSLRIDEVFVTDAEHSVGAGEQTEGVIDLSPRSVTTVLIDAGE
ncbi:MAG: glycoside hydrolase [Planctomycetota bacterium]